ncbi:uncharacterized protein UV8b_01894 [Ustilaginoidea virens]|uniref:Uncharacterized protein n=1 Tax=Ustilaginoidea virens TaxID=1159556 RepID=A0A8E5HLU9_USTVR|nr:uncharacterized protein UV8b_01894 [Ustilaginoidea virens]QUC17653.1 hypothetical protein UV8b_01894 [Ustilaginoidea virens]
MFHRCPQQFPFGVWQSGSHGFKMGGQVITSSSCPPDTSTAASREGLRATTVTRRIIRLPGKKKGEPENRPTRVRILRLRSLVTIVAARLQVR